MDRIEELREIWDGLRFYKERLDSVFGFTEERQSKSADGSAYDDELGEIENAIEYIEEAQDHIEVILDQYR